MKNLFNHLPLTGAQLIIEPDMTKDQITEYLYQFVSLDFKIGRVRLFESYMNLGNDNWNFDLFDHAYDEAGRLGVSLLGTLFPMTPFEDVGGFKFPRNDKHWEEICYYIKKVVARFSSYKSCAGWVLVNEPGTGNMDEGEFSIKRYKKEYELPGTGLPLKKILDFSHEQFMFDHTTWYLNQLANEVKKHDSTGHIHINPHGLFSYNLGQYDFKKWHSFLDSYGASAHASWHFNLFSRDKYTLAMSATCEIIRSAAQENPWIMTEIQGGNNTYSGNNPLCPTREEIVQWLLTIYCSGGKGGIFWCYNARSTGHEAGEWALIDFLGNYTDRTEGASLVSHHISENKEIYSRIKPIDSGISLLYFKESLWMEDRLIRHTQYPLEAREKGAVMASLLGHYEVLQDMGIQARIAEADLYDFAQDDYKDKVIILSHQIALPVRYEKDLDNFVNRGGILLMDGLTGFYDEEGHCRFMSESLFSQLAGARISEYKINKNIFNVKVKEITLPSHLWSGYLEMHDGKSLGLDNNRIIGSENKRGEGHVYWIPTPLGLGARLEKTTELVRLYKELFKDQSAVQSAVFKERQENLLHKPFVSGEKEYSLFINKGKSTKKIPINRKKGEIIFKQGGDAYVNSSELSLDREVSLIVEWL
jgi:beta-galactosidase